MDELNATTPWRIAIDAHMIGTGETGNETYIRGLIGGLNRVDGCNRYLLYTTDPTLLPANLTGDRFRPRRISPAGNVPRIAYAMPRAARHDRLDLLHVTYTLPPAITCRSIVSVHDISYRFFPEAFSPRDRLLLSIAVPLSMRRASRVITLSANARQDILREYRIPDWKVVAIPLAAEHHFQPVRDQTVLKGIRERYRLPERFILAVGNLQPRKNLLRLIEAFGALRQAGYREHRLILVGQSRWKESDLLTAIQGLGLENEIITTGYVPDEHLAAIYSAADVFVYPSLYEGFGLPPLEAMACGTPVITSATSAIPEVVGDAALLVEPTDVRALAVALERVLSNPDERQRLGKAGMARAAQFSWNETARRTLDVYHDVLAR